MTVNQDHPRPLGIPTCDCPVCRRVWAVSRGSSLHAITDWPRPPLKPGDDFSEVFDIWARGIVNTWNTVFKAYEPFNYSKFDGCTFAPDICLHCCLLHDLRYHFKTDRAEADRLFRECIADIGRREDRFRGFWAGVAWLYWAGVRLFGGSAR